MAVGLAMVDSTFCVPRSGSWLFVVSRARIARSDSGGERWIPPSVFTSMQNSYPDAAMYLQPLNGLDGVVFQKQHSETFLMNMRI